MKRREKWIVIILIIGVIGGVSTFFVYRNIQVSSVVQTQKQKFEADITTASQALSKEDTGSQISGVKNLQKVEAEITQFHQNVFFSEITVEYFKTEKEQVNKKIKEGLDHINFLYKVQLDSNEKDPAALSKDELTVMIDNLDKLLKEMQTEAILSADVLKTFEDKASELKSLYEAERNKKAANEKPSKPVNEPKPSNTEPTKPTQASVPPTNGAAQVPTNNKPATNSTTQAPANTTPVTVNTQTSTNNLPTPSNALPTSEAHDSQTETVIKESSVETSATLVTKKEVPTT